MPTVKELKHQAKARKVKGYSSMSKAQLMAALGVSEERKPQEPKSSAKPAKAEPTKVARAIATAIAKKHGGSRAEIEAQLKKSVAGAIDKKRKQLKKEGKEPTQKDLRAAAVSAVQATARGIVAAKGGKVADPGKAKATKPKQEISHHQQWAKTAFSNAPKDFQRVVESIPEPKKLDLPPDHPSAFKAGTGAIHIKGDRKPGDALSDGVYRHEFGHHLDYELGDRKGGSQDSWNAVASFHGLNDIDEARGSDRSAIIKQAWEHEDELGSRFASCSKKGRAAFDADDESLTRRQDAADRKLKTAVNTLPPAEKEVLRQAGKLNQDTDKAALGRVVMGRNFQRDILTQAKLDPDTATPDQKLKAITKFADKHFKGKDIHAQLYQELKKVAPDRLHDLVPHLMTAQKTGDVYLLAHLTNTALDTLNAGDMVGSATRNRIELGHKNGYYDKKIEAKYTESFANISEFYSRNHPLGNAFMQTLMPHGLEFFRGTLKDASKRRK
ncbi:hypothetical protein [Pantanalinema sp. GBBB05]|uniref:hypothetical protein n=1 Tax=Pantanalinema sp. GBBB05 TaxID=2604139 RepID=UPI001D2D4EB9|nr:hypothetical protein [Pantanalinema sp. GBBB05]